MLTLAGMNTYTGNTIVNAGVLLLKRASGSGTNAGSVQVSAGTPGGTGKAGGAVTIGNGSGAVGELAPGIAGLGTLTIQNKLTFNADAAYDFQLNSSTAAADKVIAKGVTISSGAFFSFADLGSGTLALGTVFTAIRNTASTPISGAFRNLANGSVFRVGSNTYQVSYSGGDGNDLTLTVQ